MSYNTRRTGAGPGKSGTTQVNYHQQQQRGASAPNRGQGYTTSAQPVSYNSSAQPAYQTQPAANAGYSTTQKQQSQPQTPAAAPPTTPAAAPPTTPAAVTPTPAMKQEPLTPADTPKMDTSENGDSASQKPFWKKKPFVKVPNKVKKARLNAKLRRILNPKNAITFLNELRPQGGVKFVVREEPGWGYVASVDIEGKSFSGHALTVSKAKVQASEQALRHLLMEQLSKAQAAPPPVETKKEDKDASQVDESEQNMESDDKEEGGESNPKNPKGEPQEDDVPWGSLAAFALHKLFSDWQKEGTEMPPALPEKYEEDMSEEAYYARRSAPPGEFGYPRRFPAGPFGRGRGYAPYPPRGPPFSMPRRPLPPAATFLAGKSQAAHPLTGDQPPSILPMKKIPQDANKRHPVMLLNQLKPNVVYNETKEGEAPRTVFKISIEIEGKEYVGRGKSKKEAKKNAAKAALAPLGIQYQDD